MVVGVFVEGLVSSQDTKLPSLDTKADWAFAEYWIVTELPDGMEALEVGVNVGRDSSCVELHSNCTRVFCTSVPDSGVSLQARSGFPCVEGVFVK